MPDNSYSQMKYHYLLFLFFCFSTITVKGQFSRQMVLDDYNNQYLPSSFANEEFNWIGDIDNCIVGTLSETVRAKHLQRINYYRNLVGGLAPVTLIPECSTEPLVINSSPQNCTQQPIFFAVNVPEGTYTYDFGDGTNRIEKTVSPSTIHVYDEPGEYIFTAIVEYPNGCIDTAHQEVTMISSSATFSYTINGKTIRLQADTTNAAYINSYEWMLGDGTRIFGQSTFIEHTYENVGDYIIVLRTDGACSPFPSSELVNIEETLSVEENTLNACRDGIDNDNNGLIDADDPACTCILASSIIAKFSYDFSEDSLFLNNESIGVFTNFQWTHNFSTDIVMDQTALPAPGNYEVCLIVADDCNQSDTLCQTIIIGKIGCAGIPFSIEETSGRSPDRKFCKKLPFDLSTNRPVEDHYVYYWDYGNGKTNNGLIVFPNGEPTGNTSMVYDSTGFYTIQAVLDDGSGCLDTASFDLEIIASDAAFTYDIDDDEGLTIHFQADTTGYTTSYSWEIFLDGENGFQTFSASSASFSQTFPEEGELTVSLMTLGRCPGSFDRQIIRLVQTQSESSPILCSDGVDNDKDGLVDCEDTDCGCIACPEDVIIRSQADVSQFFNQHFNCTRIEGNVTIVPSNGTIEHLDGLQHLESIGGNLTIANNLNNLSLYGLRNVRKVDGSLIVGNNASLSTLESLSINRIGGDFLIGDNPNLTKIFIEKAPAFTLEYIGGNFILTTSYNRPSQLENLGYLNNLHTINGSLSIQFQTNLVSLDGFEKLTTIGENIYLLSNAALERITSLINVTSLNGAIEIISNDRLSSLVGLDNIDPSGIKKLNLNGSDNLSFCAVRSICNYLELDNANYFISGNTSHCSSVEAVRADCNDNSVPIFFDDYPWLIGLVNPNNCTGESVLVYVSSAGQRFVLVETSQTSILYSEDGQVWCTNSDNYDCRSFYRPDRFLNAWSCEAVPPVDEDMDQVLSDVDPDDKDPCVPNSQSTVCENPPLVPIFLPDYPWIADLVAFDNCTTEKITVYRSSGYIYVLVEGPQSSILYNASGQRYCTNSPSYDCQAFYTIDEEIAIWNCVNTGPKPVDKDLDGSFSDIDPNDDDPCIPDNTVSNCDTTMNTVGSTLPDFLEDYPWLADLVDFETCTSEKITVYTSVGYIYLFVETPQQSILYNANGQRYCTNSATYDCQAFYKVDEVLAIWACGASEPIIVPVDGDGDGFTDDVDPDDMDACIPNENAALCLLESGTLPPFFEQYPWLAEVINPFDCGTTKVTVYRFSGYIYLWVEGEGFPVLYNNIGLRYCSNSANYNCQDFYTMDEVLEIWECGNSFQEEQRNPTNFKISTTNHSSLQLFPNPTTGKATLQIDKSVTVLSIQIINIHGQVIPATVNNQSAYLIDLEAQETGIYLVQVVTEEGVFSQKLIVK